MRFFWGIFFPFFDHLYIFQILEYNHFEFLKWFIKNPLKRNLQKKNHLDWTRKAVLVFLISLIFFFATVFYLLQITALQIWVLTFFALVLLFPVFLIMSSIILLPLEIYQKQRIIKTASQKIKRFTNLKIVAITGSYGKTSTKDILYTLLWKNFKVVKTPKSFNNPLSIAQTVTQDVKNNTEVFIVEVGAYKKGDIAETAEWLKPSMGLITAIAPQHLERFGSLENIAEAKFELVKSLDKNGIAFLNKENRQLERLLPQASCKIIFFGSPGSYCFATNIEITISGTSFLLHTPKGHSLITIPLIGKHHVDNFLAAATIAMYLGLTPMELKKRAEKLLPTPHRLEIRNQGSFTIIDNSYNTNPYSSNTALQLLQKYPGSQKIVLTPGLVELGDQRGNENREFAKNMAYVADDVIIVGEYNKKYLLEGLKETSYPNDKVHKSPSRNKAFQLLDKIAKKNAVVLIENDLPDQYG